MHARQVGTVAALYDKSHILTQGSRRHLIRLIFLTRILIYSFLDWRSDCYDLYGLNIVMFIADLFSCG